MGGVVHAEHQQHQIDGLLRHLWQQALQCLAGGDAILATGTPGNGAPQTHRQGRGQLAGQGEVQAGSTDPGHSGLTNQEKTQGLVFELTPCKAELWPGGRRQAQGGTVGMHGHGQCQGQQRQRRRPPAQTGQMHHSWTSTA
ncbi:hypothetical protein D9M73_171330 [compost metagenome]